VIHSIGIIETSSIAKGFEAADSMVKTANVELVEACAICPGKFLVVVVGGVADVKAAMAAGAATAGETLVDRMELANVDAAVPEALRGVCAAVDIDAMGILETFTAASGVLAADAAVKAASVTIIELRLARGMAGKSFFTITGNVGAVKAAMDAAKADAAKAGLLVQAVVIPSPHEALKRLSL
jgi:microcompartment protein CcmL/EutN